MTYFFETYGCQMNKAESASAEQLLISRGWQRAESAETADLVIINTCSVRATAENRIFGRLGWYAALKKKRAENPFTLAVMGCLAERMRNELKERYPIVDYAVGIFRESRLAEIAAACEHNTLVSDGQEKPAYSFAALSYEQGAFKSFVPIMHGCNNFCTYCIVPYLRGREISRDPAAILAELDQLSSRGVREITLLGQNVNSYRWTQNGRAVDFPELMRMIARHLRETASSIGWVRFMSSHPKDLSDELIEVIGKERVFCRHIHLPVQHGATSVLERMNRGYTRDRYLDLVSRIRSGIGDVSLSTDILIGFPGETEDEFEQTMSLMSEIRYEAAYMYYYNPRENTPAASYPQQIPMEIKKERLARIIALQLEITQSEMKRRLGKTVRVLAESVSRDDSRELLGRTERDERVVFAAEEKLIGTFAEVSLDSLSGNTFRAALR
ncbi:MAG: tRNA (N6-isopentenyl adenosine(37)-C2)-methylthiotransferase MiaB [Bacteroides sp.]|nr:tRNA (N6-isopentenyl adenosine(37)-C2)-methylthiotransferase MiaB [Prevotella sp.]MCM1408058.1 tRNA (N6-isopentenyl adenosine(37)-C2)-methylthiotransferase MiaB [Treponema brennaborense]MCM1469034.1 tRNA (N6-isopentenyl adenosine(37)-C2)-methylthiotransferase MiaB [Bacteroides sp.]